MHASKFVTLICCSESSAFGIGCGSNQSKYIIHFPKHLNKLQAEIIAPNLQIFVTKFDHILHKGPIRDFSVKGLVINSLLRYKGRWLDMTSLDSCVQRFVDGEGRELSLRLMPFCKTSAKNLPEGYHPLFENSKAGRNLRFDDLNVGAMEEFDLGRLKLRPRHAPVEPILNRWVRS